MTSGDMNYTDYLLTAIAIARLPGTCAGREERMAALKALLPTDEVSALTAVSAESEILGVMATLAVLVGRIAARLEEATGNDYLGDIRSAAIRGTS